MLAMANLLAISMVRCAQFAMASMAPTV